MEKFLHPYIPNLDGVILGHGDNVVLIWSHPNTGDGVTVGIWQLEDEVLGFGVPDLDAAVVVTRDNMGL